MKNNKNIRSLMVLNSLKQPDMAKMLGISLASFNFKLNNRRDFTLTELVKMSKYFNVTIDELVR